LQVHDKFIAAYTELAIVVTSKAHGLKQYAPGGGPQMNKPTRMPDQSQKALTPVSEKENQPVRSQRQFRRVIKTCAVLVFASFSFIPIVTAHSGLDPEIQEITEKLTKNPNSVDLLVSRGQVYRSYGKFNESLQDLERAWLLDRENRTVVLQRALTLSAMGRYGEAEAALDAFLQEKSDPKQILALAERAAIRAKTGRVELATADLTSAIQLKPTMELYHFRGKLQESLGKLDAAAAGYHDGIAKLGDSIVLKNGLIRVQIAQKEYSQALALIDEEVARSSVKTPWYLQRAEILAIMGQPDASRLAYEQALSETNRMLGKRPTALHLVARAKILNAIGQRDDATRDLREALKKSPGYDEAEKLLQLWGGG
jgi:tetratricopeptide (TPR) repeat protein